MVYGPDGTEYPSYEAAIAAGVTNPSYMKPTATTTAANIPTYGYELARLMAQYGVASPTPPRTTDQSLINQYFQRLNVPMYAEPVGNDLFNRYLDIGMGRLPGGGGPMTRFFPGQAVAPAGYRFDPVTATNVPVTAPGGVAEAGRITTGTPNIGGTQCPPGFNFDPVTRSCIPTPSTGICPVGKVLLNGRCVDATATPAPVTPAPVTPAPITPAPVTPAPGANLTDAEAAWIAQSKGFTDDQWRQAMDAWIASNPNATKQQVDAALMKFQAPERLYGYGYTQSNVIDDPRVSAGFTPATAATQFLTPNAVSGPAGADMYKMLRENIQYSLDPRSIGGAGITDAEAQQIWDLSKAQGLSIPQIAEQVNAYAGLSKTEEDIANAIRSLAPNEAEDYFKLVGYTGKADGGLASLAQKYANGGEVKADPLMNMVKKYQDGGLNTAYDQLAQARSNLRSTIEQLSAQEEVKPPSKAEMYFRLAAAFGTPTKTGDFGESLGLAAQQMAEYKGEQREAQRSAQQQRRDLALELAKLDVQSATDVIEQERLLSRANSEFGRACQDQGLVPGTPDFIACVESARQAEQTRRETAETRAANLATLQQENVQSQIEARSQRGQPPASYNRFEQGLLDNYTQRKNSAKVAAGILAEAMQLNNTAYTESYSDIIRRTGSRFFDQDDPKLAIYEFMKNRLSANALASLKSTFPGAISNAEREALDQLQGALSATREGRQMIFEATMGTMLDSIENADAEIEKIQSRYYAGPQEETLSETDQEITP